MPKKLTRNAALLIVGAIILGYIASLAVKDAGKEMGMTVGGTFVLGLLVAGATHVLPQPKPSN